MEMFVKALGNTKYYGVQTIHIFQDEWGLINILAEEHFFHSEVGETDFSITLECPQIDRLQPQWDFLIK